MVAVVVGGSGGSCGADGAVDGGATGTPSVLGGVLFVGGVLETAIAAASLTAVAAQR